MSKCKCDLPTIKFSFNDNSATCLKCGLPMSESIIEQMQQQDPYYLAAKLQAENEALKQQVETWKREAQDNQKLALDIEEELTELEARRCEGCDHAFGCDQTLTWENHGELSSEKVGHCDLWRKRE